MRTLDLSSTNLRSRDLSYFMSEISDPAAGIRLQTLNLSENPTVNDSVLKTVSYLFETSPTLQQFIFDKTSITITGLLHVLDALKDKRSIRRLSTKDNNLTLLQQQHGQQVVERLKSNFSLTELNYEHNFFDQEFAEALKSELEINKKIVRIILPQLSEQEQTAQIVAGTYIEWLHIIRLYANKANFIALDFDEVITNPQVISTSLYKLGLVSKAEDEASSKLFAKYTRDLIAEVDKKQHGDLYAERCAVPIENRKSRQDYNFPPEDLMQLEEEYKRVKESIQVLA